VKRILFELSTQKTGDRGAGAEDSPAGFSPVARGRFRKEVIREGTWIHPTRNFRLSVTRDRMRRWVEKFRLMRKRGIRVPVPFGHSYDPKDNAGFVEELELVGNTLVAVLHIPDDRDARKLGATVRDVSLSINPDFRDGQGRRYGEVVEHVALTTRPVVPGQGDFVPLELPDGSRAELWHFELESLRPRADGASDSERSPLAQSGANAQGQGVETPCPANSVRIRDGQESGLSPLAPGTAGAQRQGSGPGEPAAESNDADDQTGRATASEAPAGTGPQPGPDDPAGPPCEADGSQQERLALERELDELRRASLQRELDELVRSGRLTPAMREPVLKLLAVSEPVSLQLDGSAQELDVAGAVRSFLEAIPENGLVDLRRRTVFEVPRPVGQMTDERAARLAEENRRLAKLDA